MANRMFDGRSTTHSWLPCLCCHQSCQPQPGRCTCRPPAGCCTSRLAWSLRHALYSATSNLCCHQSGQPSARPLHMPTPSWLLLMPPCLVPPTCPILHPSKRFCMHTQHIQMATEPAHSQQQAMSSNRSSIGHSSDAVTPIS